MHRPQTGGRREMLRHDSSVHHGRVSSGETRGHRVVNLLGNAHFRVCCRTDKRGSLRTGSNSQRETRQRASHLLQMLRKGHLKLLGLPGVLHTVDHALFPLLNTRTGRRAGIECLAT